MGPRWRGWRGEGSGFPKIEAAFDAVEPFFRAIGAHRDIRVMAGFGGREVGDADFQRGESMFHIAHILAQAVDLVVDAAEIPEDDVFGVFGHVVFSIQMRARLGQ